MCVCVCVHACECVLVSSAIVVFCVCFEIDELFHTRRHTHMHARTHACMQAHTHTHKHTQCMRTSQYKEIFKNIIDHIFIYRNICIYNEEITTGVKKKKIMPPLLNRNKSCFEHKTVINKTNYT